MLTQLPNTFPVIIANDSKHSYANQETNHLLPQANDSESATSSSPSGQSSQEHTHFHKGLRGWFEKIVKSILRTSVTREEHKRIIVNINIIFNCSLIFFIIKKNRKI